MADHHNREDLAGEHRFGDMGQFLLFLIFIAVWITDSFFLHFSTFLSTYVPLYLRIPISGIILFTAGYFAKKGLNIVFGEIREKPAVIRKGVFNIVRHPVYLGAILIYPGFFILTMSIISTFIWFLIIAFFYFISKHEEKLLLSKFGEEYEKYRNEVPMLIPRIKIKKS
ncbi:methyltransferase family protein [candidate division KSB1 bacterium]